MCDKSIFSGSPRFHFIPPIRRFKDAEKHSAPNLFLPPQARSIVTLE